ncbi:MAG: helix-turn-helix domain-containing protein [Phascolarctobacterium sp.]|uniref:helix-turn-helix domain-containing protein n=1 Tax=Phascolarctobacterium sp. TaxID=2049039 RepID=UPI0025EFFF8E|nr:helix-turn-helix transcriptional regulator [Phascolarctobacterium sp.]MCC8158470.1 helix-turn-helix domain-containing protein [Phascolarctobacterium sp.]
MYDEKCLMCIGGNIRFLRMACQVSQQDMAERIGISQTHLSNLEHNHSSVNLKLLLRIANVLECPLEIFLDTNAALDWGKEQAEKATADL